MNNKLQMEEMMEERQCINLLGPYRLLTRLTGLDCTAVAKAREGKGSKCCAFIVHFIAIIVIISMFFRTLTLFGIEGNPLSLAWAESNFFAFMGIHSIVCAFCLYGWTKNGFIPKHTQTLEQLRSFRIVENNDLDVYSKLHTKCAIFAVPLFFTMMFAAVFAAVYKKITFGSEEKPMYLYTAMAVIAFFAWLIVTLCLTIYTIVQVSLEREIVYFNEELQKASDEKILSDIIVFNAFSSRQVEIIKMVNQANVSLGSYAKFAPLFCFFSIINVIYLTGFYSQLPGPYFTCILFSLFCTIGITVTALKTASGVQDALAATSKVLLLNEDLEKSENPQVYQTYRIVVDRSLKSDTRMYLLNGFPIDSTSFNIAMFVVPNMGPILLMIKKVLEANGISV